MVIGVFADGCVRTGMLGATGCCWSCACVGVTGSVVWEAGMDAAVVAPFIEGTLVFLESASKPAAMTVTRTSSP